MNIIDTIRVSGTDYTLSATSSGGTEAVEVTQAEYDALASGGTVDPTVFYIITDAQAGDLTQYWTSAQTNSAITQAVSGKVDTSTYNTYTAATDTALGGKQATLVSGTNIKTINNESILGSGNIDIQGGGGGGKAIEAGRGIDVASGTSSYTVSFNLPISAGTGSNSIIEGSDTTASGSYSHAEGYYSKAQAEASHAEGYSTAKESYCHSEGYATQAYAFRSHAEGAESVTYGDTSHAEGKDTRTYNHAEHASGAYNVSSSASTTFGDSGNTLFSVGNGTADNARHNALEIRQNGDIYITLNGQDVKLQDNLGGGGGGGKAIEAGRGISITTGETADTINCTLPISASTGAYSAMLGQPTSTSDASGSKTITGGQWSKATAEGAVSIGQMNQSSGQWAWAIGNNNKSKGKASFACGNNTSANGNYAFSEGTYTTANTEASHSAGSYTSTKNRSELSIGEYNNSVSASTTFGDSGNTLFSVGNGTSTSARHNAFEIRQNGDIYCSDGTNDVKLQDTITATAANTTALGGLKLVKLTQSEYDALATKDNSTLYVIVN